MEDLPPKNLKNQLVRLDHNLKQIERSHYAGIQRAPGSLPVLEAFQEFLDNERRKTKKRMVVLMTTFVFILLAVVGSGSALVYWQMRRVDADFSAVSAETDSLATALTEQAETGRQAREALAAHQAQLAAAQSNAVAQLAGNGGRVTTLEGALERISAENAELKADLERAMRDWPVVAAKVEALIDQKTGRDNELILPPQPQATQEAVAPPERALAMPAATAGKASDPSTVMLTIVPPGESHGIRWRLPAIPE
jgi:cell division protein FtsB